MYDIRIQGEERHRLSVEQVRSLIHSGEIDGTILVRLHGDKAWLPLSAFSEFAADHFQPVPPVPPVPPEIQAERLANSSLNLGVMSILCGLTALPAMIQSIRALVLLRKVGGTKTTYAKAIFGTVFSACFLGFVIFTIGSALGAAKRMAGQINCVNNLKQLSLAVKIYEGDNGDTFPPADRWCDVLLTEQTNAASGVSSSASDFTKVFHCPAFPRKQRCSYAMNRQLAGIKDNGQIMPDTVLLFESDAGWNAVGGVENIKSYHYSGVNVAFVDGSVDYIEFKNVGKLRWNPFTNAPAELAK